VKSTLKKPTLNARRGDIFFIEHNDPNVLVEIVSDQKHALFDHSPRPVNREMVETLKMRGQEVPALGWVQPGLRDGKQVVHIVAGRRRWKAIQIAWAELLAEGVSEQYLPPFRLIVKPYVDELDAFEAWIVENCHRG
jgi:hypothetical protein